MKKLRRFFDWLKPSRDENKINWQPMDTAPKDGTEVLLYLEYCGFPIISLAFFEDEAWHMHTTRGIPGPGGETHLVWMHWAPYNPPQEAGI